MRIKCKVYLLIITSKDLLTHVLVSLPLRKNFDVQTTVRLNPHLNCFSVFSVNVSVNGFIVF